MFDSLIQSIENTFIQFSFKRLLYILFLLALVLSALYIFDRATGYTTFTRIDKQIGALERLQTLEEKGIQSSDNLAPIYENIVSELKQQPREGFSFRLSYDPIIKFSSAAAIPAIFVIYALIKMMGGSKQRDWSKTLVGALIATFILGVPAVIIPNWRTPWINAVLYFIVQIIFIWWLIKSDSTETVKS